MKKIAITLFTVVTFISCATSQNAQKKDTKVPTMLVGEKERTDLTQKPFDTWFNKNYESYQVDTEALKNLIPLLKGVTIKVFMGTWCGDSKRETPRFYKIMDAAKVKKRKITLITMNRSKKTPDKFEEGLNITNVPTFIFYKNGEEINRIVEYPIETLEKDMIALLSGKAYKHAYAD